MLSQTQHAADSIFVTCKKCGQNGYIQLPPEVHLLSNGLRNILVPAGTLCSHDFLVFIDKNCQVRGYQHVDITLSLQDVGSRNLLDLISPQWRSPNESAGEKGTRHPRFEEVQGLLKDFSNAVDHVKAIFIITNDGGIYSASEEDYAIAGDLSGLVTTISEFSLSVSQQLQFDDAPSVLQIQGNESRTLIFTRPFGFLVLTHDNPNQGLIAVATRRILAKLLGLLAPADR
ncbi:MAG: hypothetical protein ACTSU5_05450 [Promethearchaeota archaeon]